MDWNQLEEGRRRLKEVVNQNKDRTIVKWYLVYLTYMMMVYVMRPELPLETVVEVVETREIYSTMISQKVEDEEEKYIQQTIDQMNLKKEKEGVQCLAAIHIGIPLQIIQIGETVYINPKKLGQGKKISQAYESSLFFPNREPKKMLRYLPIHIETEKGDEFLNGWRGHCMINLLDQMEGKTIYEL